MPVNIHGKNYKTVAERINEFRNKFPGHAIQTEIVELTDEFVVIKASILKDGVVISTGFAHEVKAASSINRTSFVENCETSAVGRALAFFGLAGDEIASAEELENAIEQQKAQDAPITATQIKALQKAVITAKSDLTMMLGYYEVKDIKELKGWQFADAMKLLKKKEGKA